MLSSADFGEKEKQDMPTLLVNVEKADGEDCRSGEKSRGPKISVDLKGVGTGAQAHTFRRCYRRI